MGHHPHAGGNRGFRDDTSPDAYEKLVDRLLASPHFGERQARLWLDLSRYADSAGFQTDQTRSDMWRFRDYVINAFNQTSLIPASSRSRLLVTNWRRQSRTSWSPQAFWRDIQTIIIPRLGQRKFQITTDITDTVGQAILGTTVVARGATITRRTSLLSRTTTHFSPFLRIRAKSTRFPRRRRCRTRI